MSVCGIVRNMDSIGRVVIPKELRDSLGIKSGDPIEILAKNNEIVIKKYNSGCIFCGSDRDIIEFGSEHICSKCRDKLSHR